MDRADELWIRAMVDILEAKIRTIDEQGKSTDKMTSEQVRRMEKFHEDQEFRIRKLESFMWKAVGAGCLAGAMAGVSVQFLL